MAEEQVACEGREVACLEELGALGAAAATEESLER
jgi:hypothetical protein